MRIGDRGEMVAFVRSVELASFSAAARELGLTPSAVSKLVTRLEAGLEVRLLNRSTRNVVATAEGELFLARCRRILAEMEDAETELSRRRERPRGRLRLHMGIGFGMSQGIHALPQFSERYPDVELDVMLEDRRVDPLRENIDISTWSFPPEGANLVARKLFEYDRVLCAAPAYLERFGTPKSPAELARHRCLLVSNLQGQTPWIFRNGKRLEAVDVVASISVNNAETKYHLAVGGMGIAQFSEYIVADALREGTLVRVLEECHAAPPLVQYAIFQPDRHRLPRVAAMLQFLVETFGPRPWRRQRASVARREALAA